MKIDIWSDVVCPWCYIGKKRFEKAVAEAGVDVTVMWHAFELDPQAPERLEGTLTRRLAQKYGTTEERMVVLQEHVRQTGEGEGITFRFAEAVTGNTFDAHRLILYAHEQGLGSAQKERLMRAYFSEGLAIGEREVLLRLAHEVGVSAPESAFLEDVWGERVRVDEATARRSGITGVPFFVIDGQYAVSGAQPTEVFANILRQLQPDVAAGVVCDDGACDVPN